MRLASLLVAFYVLTFTATVCASARGCSGWKRAMREPTKFVTASFGMGNERSLRAGADPKAGVGFGEGHGHGRDG